MAEMQVGGWTIRVEIWTEQYRLLGDVSAVISGGKKGRFSDVLNEPGRPFLALSNVTLSSLDGKDLWGGDFLAVNKAAVVLAKVIVE